MKKEDKIVLFGSLYLLFFTLLYTFIFFDARGILLFSLILAVFHLPSFVCILIILFYAKFKKVKIPDLLYYTTSFLVFIITFLIFTSGDKDPKNIYPIFEEHIFIIILLCLMSNMMAYFSIKFINKRKEKNVS